MREGCSEFPYGGERFAARLFPQGPLQARGHLVERLRHTADLVLFHIFDPVGQIAGRDGVGAANQLSQGAGHSRDQHDRTQQGSQSHGGEEVGSVSDRSPEWGHVRSQRCREHDLQRRIAERAGGSEPLLPSPREAISRQD